MNDRAAALAASLIRNFNDAPAERLVREPHYDSSGALTLSPKNVLRS